MSTGLITIATAGMTGFTAILFAQAALHKLADFTAFTGFVQDYELLPEAMIRPASALIVVAEIATVAALLIPGLRGVGLVLAAILLCAYAVAMRVNLMRGRSQIECGCGGAAQPISTGLVARNLVISAVVLCALAVPPAPLGTAGAISAIAAALLGFALYLLANQILSNAAQIARLSEGGRP